MAEKEYIDLKCSKQGNHVFVKLLHNMSWRHEINPQPIYTKST